MSNHFLVHLTTLWHDSYVIALEAQDVQRSYADRTRCDDFHAVGDRVLLNRAYRFPLHHVPKLSHLWDGPFTIVRQINPVTYELQLPDQWKLHPVIWVGYLKPFRGDGFVPPPPDTDDDGELRYTIEAVVGHRTRRGKTEYLVHWKGYSVADRSWVLASELQQAKDVVSAYHSLKTAGKRRSKRTPAAELACLHCRNLDSPPTLDEESSDDEPPCNSPPIWDEEAEGEGP